MARYSVFLVSRSEQENMILSRRLEPLREEFGDFPTVSLHPQGLTTLAHESVSLVVFNFTEWTSAEVAWLYELRNSGYVGTVLILARYAATKSVSSLGELEGVVYLEKPFETKELLGIVGKALRTGEVGQQYYKRYSTDQDAEIEFLGQGERFGSRVCNLSRGGAYLELAGRADLEIGDMLNVTFDLKQVNRVYTLPAKVVWMQPAAAGGSPGVGVEFIGPGDVKRSQAGW